MATPKLSTYTSILWGLGSGPEPSSVYDRPTATVIGVVTVNDVAPTATSKSSANSPVTSTGPPVTTKTDGANPSNATTHPTTSSSSNSTLIQPTFTVVPSTSSSGIPAGGVAGIAIGCAIFGLLAGLLAACVILRRKKGRNDEADAVIIHHELQAHTGDTTTIPSLASGIRREKAQNDDADAVMIYHELEAHTSKTTTVPSLASGIQMGQFLLEATSERDIAQEVQSIGELIQQHVGNHYHLKPVNTDIQGLSATLTRLGFAGTSSSIDAHGIAALCTNTTTRQSGIQHVIMRTMLKSIDFYSQSGLPSVLPRPIATFLQALPPIEQYHNADSQAMSLALRQWRKLSAFLLHPSRSHRTSLPMDEARISLEAHELAKCLNIFLHNFVEPDPAVVQEQASHLEAVIMECAKLGHVLLSQPANWGLVTDATSTAGGPQTMVVEPGLEKLSDGDGPGYSQPRRVVEPVIIVCHSTE